MKKQTTTILGTIVLAIAITAFAGPAYGGGDDRGKENGNQAAASPPGNSENAPGQAKKLEQAQPPAQGSVPEPAPGASGDAPGQAAGAPPSPQPAAPIPTTDPASSPAPTDQRAKPATRASASASASSSARKDGHSKSQRSAHGNATTAAASAHGNATATATSPGVKPSNSTAHNVSAPAGSNSTKLYGNGQTAGQIAMRNGASPSTMLYGPGNSQPHKVSPCGHKTHGNGGGFDVHALKSHRGKNACVSEQRPSPVTPHTSGSSPSTPAAPGSGSPARSVAAVNASDAQASPSIRTDKRKAAVASARATIRKNAVDATAPFTPPRFSTVSKGAKPEPRTLSALATSHTGTLPFTGIQLWALALVGLGLVGAGWTLRRQARVTV
jgi:hypothetical protein